VNEAPVRLERAVFKTSRLLDFVGRRELTAQVGHDPTAWPLVILKELFDNALDACEEAEIAPEIKVEVSTASEAGLIRVDDNGPGLPPEVVTDILDYSVRVSSREAYVSPTRGAQGNALKTIIAMPYAVELPIASPSAPTRCDRLRGSTTGPKTAATLGKTALGSRSIGRGMACHT